MSLELTGTATATLQSVARKVAHIPGALPRIATAIARDAQARVQLGFRKSADPYGNAWAALISRDGKPLMNRGILANSFSATAEGTTVRLGTNAPFADVHQGGKVIVPRRAKALRFKIRGAWVTTKRVVIPARPMVPTRAGGMPSKWSLGFVNIARTMVAQVLRG